jgi:hypothetical protein
MNIFRQLLIYSMAAFLLAACNEGIDPISQVDPGPDESAPQVIIRSPAEGYQILAPQALAPVTISFEASDDIELGSVTVSIDGNQVASFNEFRDYRRFVHQFVQENIATGPHVLQVTATDLEGKSTTQAVNFEKVPPYVPKYQGEIFYMPFNGDFTEMISFEEATVVGNPGFTSQNIKGGNAYAGANESYLTFPGEELQNAEFSAVFWMNINAAQTRAGILVMSPEDAANPTAQNVRTSGFRFFREGSGTNQTFKLNVGTGGDEAWFDGGAAASIDPTATDWVHFAFTISATEAVVYMNGNVVSSGALTGFDWTGADLLSIMSGAPRFTGWDHFSDQSFMDELRIFNRVLTQADIQGIIEEESGEIPQFEGRYGEIFYMPFDGNFVEQASGTEANRVGSPGFEEGISGEAYAGAEGAYLTFPADRIQNNNFSATFWMNVNAPPARAGILVLSPEDTENANHPNVQNLRTSGFRFFREAHANGQIFKLNVGTGESDSWFDGGATATVDPGATEWVHFAFTISEDHAVIYIDGEIVSEGDFAGIDWTGADLLTIMSGAPRFTEWEHFSDQSLMDELRIFDRTLTQQEIQTMISDMDQ